MVGITDGTSNTAAVSERVKGIGTYPEAVFDTLKPTTSFVGNRPTASMAAKGVSPQQAYQTCFAISPTPANVTTGSAVDPLNGFWTDAEPSQEM